MKRHGGSGVNGVLTVGVGAALVRGRPRLHYRLGDYRVPKRESCVTHRHHLLIPAGFDPAASMALARTNGSTHRRAAA